MKTLAILFLAAALALAPASFGEPASPRLDSPQRANRSVRVMVTVDGDEVGFDQPPVMRSSRVLVPVRGVFEKIGATVEWLPERQMVVATHGEKKIELWINQRDATIDGATKTLDQPAIIVQGRAMVPLRFLSEALGADVDWIAHDMHVKIVTK